VVYYLSTSSYALAYHSPVLTEHTYTAQEPREDRREIERRSRAKRTDAFEKVKSQVTKLLGKSYVGKRVHITVLNDAYELLV
jgi:hypothetical protein